jgi:hypothetical protein
VASREVTKTTESWLLLPRGKRIWRQDGGMEYNTRKTLPGEVPAGLLGVQHQEQEQESGSREENDPQKKEKNSII